MTLYSQTDIIYGDDDRAWRSGKTSQMRPRLPSLFWRRVGDSLPVLPDGLLRASRIPKGDAQVEMGRPVVGLQPESLLKMRDRLRQAAGPRQRDPEVVLEFRVVRPEPQG